MPSPANSDDDETLDLTLSFSQMSSDDFDEQVAQLPPEGSASVNCISRPRAPTSDDLALALSLSPPPPDDAGDDTNGANEKAALASLLMAMFPEEVWTNHIDILSNH
jgi:hypothetical protein